MILKTQRKRINMLFGVLLLCNNGLCSYAAGGGKPKNKSLEEQIAACIQYPERLSHTQASVTVVSFRVDSNGQITEVLSHAVSKELDTYLIRSLCRKKLDLLGQNQAPPYVVRIRFRPIAY